MKPVKPWWNTNEWTDNKVEQVLEVWVVLFVEEASVLCVMHHQDKSLDPEHCFQGPEEETECVGWIVPHDRSEWQVEANDVGN